MGRTLKRVPLDFMWPLKKIWEGYLNPFRPEPCPDCTLGYSKEGQFLHDSFYYHMQGDLWGPYVGYPLSVVPADEELNRRGLSSIVRENIRLARFFQFESCVSWRHHLDKEDVRALVKEGRLRDFTHKWVVKNGKGKWVSRKHRILPSPARVNAWDANGIGHDAINCGILIEHRCKQMGVQHRCKTCKGSAQKFQSKGHEKKYEAWVRVEPPHGDGFQLWETTSEGAPISPVFQSLDVLCSWCAENATTFADARASADEWKAMLEKDFVHHQVGNVVMI